MVMIWEMMKMCPFMLLQAMMPHSTSLCHFKCRHSHKTIQILIIHCGHLICVRRLMIGCWPMALKEHHKSTQTLRQVRRLIPGPKTSSSCSCQVMWLAWSLGTLICPAKPVSSSTLMPSISKLRPSNPDPAHPLWTDAMCAMFKSWKDGGCP